MTDDREGRENLATAYRICAKEAEDAASKSLRQEVCDAYTKLAMGWQKLADDTEPKLAMTSNPMPLKSTLS